MFTSVSKSSGSAKFPLPLSPPGSREKHKYYFFRLPPIHFYFFLFSHVHVSESRVCLSVDSILQWNWQLLFKLGAHRIMAHSTISSISDLIKYDKYVDAKQCLGKGEAPRIAGTEHPDPSVTVGQGHGLSPCPQRYDTLCMATNISSYFQGNCEHVSQKTFTAIITQRGKAAV